MITRLGISVVFTLSCVSCSTDSDGSTPTGTPATSTSASAIVPAGAPTTPAPPAADTTLAPDTALATALTAAALTDELSAIEAGLRVPDASPAELAALGERQQLAYRAVNRHPEWHVHLRKSVDAVAAGPLEFHLAARAAQTEHAANRSAVAPATTLPAWTIVEPLPIDELLGYYREAQTVTGVPWQYLAAIHFQETRMGRVVGVSSAGAIGPMQFLPSTWAACCEGDATVARDAIIGAAQYLVDRGGPADMHAALYGYNPNDGYVGAVTAYAQAMIADERAYLGYHGWQVFYGTSEGTVRLPVGYMAATEVDVLAYVREHPEDVLPGV